MAANTGTRRAYGYGDCPRETPEGLKDILGGRCLCVYVYVCVRVEDKGEGRLPLLPSTVYFETGSLTRAGAHGVARLAASEQLGSS